MTDTSYREIDLTATLDDGSVESYCTEVWTAESLIGELLDRGATHIEIEPM